LQLAAKRHYYANKVPYLLAAWWSAGKLWEFDSLRRSLVASATESWKKGSSSIYTGELLFKEGLPKCGMAKLRCLYNSRKRGVAQNGKSTGRNRSVWDFENYQRATEIIWNFRSANSEWSSFKAIIGVMLIWRLRISIALASFSRGAKSGFQQTNSKEDAYLTMRSNYRHKRSFQLAISALDEYWELPSGKIKFEAENWLSEALVNYNITWSDWAIG